MHLDIEIDSGCFVLSGGAIVGANQSDLPNGFIGLQQDVHGQPVDLHLPARIATTAEYGTVDVELQAHTMAPPLPGPEWTDVVDVSVESFNEPVGLVVESLFDGPDFSEPPLTPNTGLYRLRVSARGRDQPWTGDVAESYRFDAWPIKALEHVMIHRYHETV